jgi:hypothetical protein
VQQCFSYWNSDYYCSGVWHRLLAVEVDYFLTIFGRAQKCKTSRLHRCNLMRCGVFYVTISIRFVPAQRADIGKQA